MVIKIGVSITQGVLLWLIHRDALYCLFEIAAAAVVDDF